MDPSANDFMPQASGSPSRCPALRSAAEGQRGAVTYYDPVHSHSVPSGAFRHQRSDWRSQGMPGHHGFIPNPALAHEAQASHTQPPYPYWQPTEAFAGQVQPPVPHYRPPVQPLPRFQTLVPMESGPAGDPYTSFQSAHQIVNGTNAGFPAMNSMHTAPAAQITSNVSISYDNAQPGQQPGSSGTPHRPHVSYPTPTDRRSNLPGEGEGLPPPVTSTSRSGSLPSTPQRRGGQTRLSRSGSDWNGDEEGAPQEDPAYHFFDSFPDSLREDPLRPQQFLRGAVSSRRVASKTAVASLQSVPLSELPDGEKICIICYNDFGVENPEGINEAPLRLPKCKHVFGDHCIKKWFEDSDSCPYCRDKVHSEPVLRPSSSNTQSIFNYLRRQQAQFQIHALRQQNRERVRTESGTVPTEPTQDDFFRGSGMPPGSLGDFAAYAHHRRSDGPNLPAGARHNTAWTAASGRRSPPNETGDSRRRTRPRHNTMRGSPPSIRSNGRSSTWASAPAINDLPSFPHHWVSRTQIGRPSPFHPQMSNPLNRPNVRLDIPPSHGMAYPPSGGRTQTQDDDLV